MANAIGATQVGEAAPAVKKDATTGGTAESDDSRKDSTDKAAVDDLIELTKPVVGTVLDEEGKPIAGAQVVLKLLDFGGETTITYRQFTIRRWETKSDESGRYSVDVAGRAGRTL